MGLPGRGTGAIPDLPIRRRCTTLTLRLDGPNAARDRMDALSAAR